MATSVFLLARADESYSISIEFAREAERSIFAKDGKIHESKKDLDYKTLVFLGFTEKTGEHIDTFIQDCHPSTMQDSKVFATHLAVFLCGAREIHKLTSRVGYRVYCGRKKLNFGAIAYHWAIAVEDISLPGKFMWYEVAGAAKSDANSPNVIFERAGDTSENGVAERVKIGHTLKSKFEIAAFVESWKLTHANYNLHGDNCQKFSEDFAIFLCGPQVVDRLPLDDHHKIKGLAVRTLGTAGVGAAAAGFFIGGQVVGLFGCMVGVFAAAVAFSDVASTLEAQHKRGYRS